MLHDMGANHSWSACCALAWLHGCLGALRPPASCPHHPQELLALDPEGALRGVSAWPRTFHLSHPPRMLLAADAVNNALAGGTLALALAAWARPAQLPGLVPSAGLACSGAAAGAHFLACAARGRSPLAAAFGLWWEDAGGGNATGSLVLAAHVLDSAYACATLGLGLLVNLSLRWGGSRSLGERAAGLAPVRETLVPGRLALRQ